MGDESTPLLVDALSAETVIAVACGDGQTLAVTTNGDVWGWGCFKDKEGKKWFNPDASSGKPASKDIKKQQNTPIKIQGLSDVVDVACGASFNLVSRCWCHFRARVCVHVWVYVCVCAHLCICVFVCIMPLTFKWTGGTVLQTDNRAVAKL